MSRLHIAAAPSWTGLVIGLLIGLLAASVWLFLRERGVRAGEYADQTLTVTEQPSGEVIPVADGTQAAVSSPTADFDPVTSGRRTAIVQATEAVADAVVSINVLQHRVYRSRNMEIWERFFPGMFPRREFYQDVQSLGSGFIITADGYLVSNYHVVADAVEIIVTLSDGREFTAELIETVPRHDLALMKIDGEDLPVAPLADRGDLQIGEWAIAIGSPFGYLLADTQPTVTVGVISALNRDIKSNNPYPGQEQVYLGMIQTDAAINPGNSGGPLVTADGRVIGVNTFILTESGGSIGIGFAVPIARVHWLIDEVLNYGRYREPYVGVAVQPLSPNLIRALGLQDPVGCVVREVEEGSPAWKAGLRVWDVIREIDGVPLEDFDAITRLWYEAKVGTELVFVAEREGERFRGRIEVAESPRSLERR